MGRGTDCEVISREGGVATIGVRCGNSPRVLPIPIPVTNVWGRRAAMATRAHPQRQQEAVKEGTAARRPRSVFLLRQTAVRLGGRLPSLPIMERMAALSDTRSTVHQVAIFTGLDWTVVNPCSLQPWRHWVPHTIPLSTVHGLPSWQDTSAHMIENMQTQASPSSP